MYTKFDLSMHKMLYILCWLPSNSSTSVIIISVVPGAFHSPLMYVRKQWSSKFLFRRSQESLDSGIVRIFAAIGVSTLRNFQH